MFTRITRYPQRLVKLLRWLWEHKFRLSALLLGLSILLIALSLLVAHPEQVQMSPQSVFRQQKWQKVCFKQCEAHLLFGYWVGMNRDAPILSPDGRWLLLNWEGTHSVSPVVVSLAKPLGDFGRFIEALLFLITFQSPHYHLEGQALLSTSDWRLHPMREYYLGFTPQNQLITWPDVEEASPSHALYVPCSMAIVSPQTGQTLVILKGEVSKPYTEDYFQWQKLYVSFGANGRYLCVAALGVWDTQTGKQIWRFPNTTAWSGGCVSPDGQLVACLGKREMRVYSLATGKLVFLKAFANLPSDGPEILRVLFSEDGRYLIGLDVWYRLWVWRVRDWHLCWRRDAQDFALVPGQADVLLVANPASIDTPKRNLPEIYRLADGKWVGVFPTELSDFSLSKDGSWGVFAGTEQGFYAPRDSLLFGPTQELLRALAQKGSALFSCPHHKRWSDIPHY